MIAASLAYIAFLAAFLFGFNRYLAGARRRERRDRIRHRRRTRQLDVRAPAATDSPS